MDPSRNSVTLRRGAAFALGVEKRLAVTDMPAPPPAAHSLAHETDREKQAHQNTLTASQVQSKDWELERRAARALVFCCRLFASAGSETRNTNSHSSALASLSLSLLLLPSALGAGKSSPKVHPLEPHIDAPPRAPRAGTLRNRLHEAHLPLWPNGMLKFPSVECSRNNTLIRLELF
jgi:hypothetical protein